MEEKKDVSRASLRFLGGTLISRLSGLLRDIAMAASFGTTPEVATFLIAFRFSNFLRRLLGESALSASFIPYFESERAGGSHGALFFRDCLFSLLALLLGIVLLAEVGLSFSHESPVLSYAKWMVPGLIFISLYGLTSSLLQCERKFFLPAIAPIGFNIVWSAAALYCAKGPSPFIALSKAITLAFAAQWLLTLPPTWRWIRSHLTLKEIGAFQLFPPSVRQAIRPFLLGFIGIGALQINSLLDTLFARAACPEGPAYLWYALRLQQVPLALIGIGLGSALMPSISRAIKGGESAKGDALLKYAIVRGFALLLPAMLGLLLVGHGILERLFGYGSFDQGSIAQTARALYGYALALPFAGWTVILAPLFYAQGNYRHPLDGVLVSIGGNIALHTLLVFGFHMGAESVAIATSVSALANFIYLKRGWSAPLPYKALARIGGCALIALLSALKGGFYVQGGLFTIVYFATARLFKVEEVLDLARTGVRAQN